MSDAYREFVARKAPAARPAGLAEVPALNPALFPFQRDVTAWALRRGRCAIFAGTGLGKTLMQLSWADAMREHAGGSVLILTPLAVAQQTVEEAARFDVEGVAYAPDHGAISSSIVVTNYDRMERFDFSAFAAVVLDESSIIKSYDGQTRRALMEACAGIPYRLCCTATPAPNDYVELGQHAEFLGVMSAKEMLATWFVHDGGIRATGAGDRGSAPAPEWRLKRHAERDFWRWVASWAVLIRRPSDLGYPDEGYALPPLTKRQITVKVEHRPAEGALFQMEASTLQERLAARRDSIAERVTAAAALVNAQPDRPWLVWCNLNAEEEALCRAIPGAVPVRGTDDRDVKAARLLGFAHGEPRILVTKPTVAGFGMNWQHCADVVFVGLNDSFEQLYQAIRRCWRFGQKRPVNVYLVASELEGAVVANLEEKERAFEAMAEALAGQLRGLREPIFRAAIPPTRRMEVPAWLAA